eukprot:PhM_4_TR10295/c0_g3_i1/m.77245
MLSTAVVLLEMMHVTLDGVHALNGLHDTVAHTREVAEGLRHEAQLLHALFLHQPRELCAVHRHRRNIARGGRGVRGVNHGLDLGETLQVRGDFVERRRVVLPRLDKDVERLLHPVQRLLLLAHVVHVFDNNVGEGVLQRRRGAASELSRGVARAHGDALLRVFHAHLDLPLCAEHVELLGRALAEDAQQLRRAQLRVCPDGAQELCQRPLAVLQETCIGHDDLLDGALHNLGRQRRHDHAGVGVGERFAEPRELVVPARDVARRALPVRVRGRCLYVVHPVRHVREGTRVDLRLAHAEGIRHVGAQRAHGGVREAVDCLAEISREYIVATAGSGSGVVAAQECIAFVGRGRVLFLNVRRWVRLFCVCHFFELDN